MLGGDCFYIFLEEIVELSWHTRLFRQGGLSGVCFSISRCSEPRSGVHDAAAHDDWPVQSK